MGTPNLAASDDSIGNSTNSKLGLALQPGWDNSTPEVSGLWLKSANQKWYQQFQWLSCDPDGTLIANSVRNWSCELEDGVKFEEVICKRRT